MQTVAKVVERLDMSAEEAVEKLRYLLFDVKSVDDEITDEQFDLLADIDDDPDSAEEHLKKRKAALEAPPKKAKKKSAAKKKPSAAKKKAPAKKKTTTARRKKSVAEETPVSEKKEPVAEIVAEIIPDEAPPASAAPGAEIVSDETAAPKAPAAEIAPEAKPAEPSEPSITIGTAIEHETHAAEVIRADGTHQDVADVDIPDTPAEADADSSEGGLLAQAEREAKAKEKEKKDRAKKPEKPLPTPDPEVLADVIRKAGQKQGRDKARTGPKIKEIGTEDGEWQEEVRTTTRIAGAVQVPVPRNSQASKRSGKTARKRMRKQERSRREDDLRRQAAAAVKEYQSGAMETGGKKKRKKRPGEEDAVVPTGPTIVEVEDTMSVEALAQALDIEVNELILELMDHNVMATKNQLLSLDLIRALAAVHGAEVRAVIPEEEDLMAETPDDPADLQPRAPVVTVMGHVDHGKTSLLDQVRKASVASGEAGGITQHIAAYEVELPQGRVVFLDTPGHEAFTALRARGAQVTDVVVLVVAADDGVMPQTKEAIDHAKAAGVPIVVAVNKCDKPDAQPERIRQELTQFELVDEQWGGKTVMRDISALKGEGIDDLMELLVLETDLLELKANPAKPARGTIIESEIARGLGPVAWVLVQSGTLRIGDVFLAGETYGRVRSMENAKGEKLDEAGPSTPVVVTGFNNPPAAGDIFVSVEEERVARTVAEKRAHRSKMKEGPAARHVTLEDFHARLQAGEKAELNVIVKTDVQGSMDVLETSLPKVGNEEVAVKIIHAGVGTINESDVLLANVTDSVILGFHVSAAPKAERMAQAEGVDVRYYTVIYELLEDVRKALEGLLTPDQREVVLGHAEIRAVFKSSAVGNIAGCMVVDGEITRDSRVRVKRGEEVVHEGSLTSLRRERDSVASVQQGFECGIKVANFDAIQEGDIVEAYKIEQVAKTLA